MTARRPPLFATRRQFEAWCARNNPHRPGTRAFRDFITDQDRALERRHDLWSTFVSGLGVGAFLAAIIVITWGGAV